MLLYPVRACISTALTVACVHWHTLACISHTHIHTHIHTHKHKHLRRQAHTGGLCTSPCIHARPCAQAIATDYKPQTPELDRKFLEREAAQGLPVKGMKQTWNENRPTVLPTMNADKVGKCGRGPGRLWGCRSAGAHRLSFACPFLKHLFVRSLITVMVSACKMRVGPQKKGAARELHGAGA